MEIAPGPRQGPVQAPKSERGPRAGSVERRSGAEKVQAYAQAQVDETDRGKDLGESFGAVVRY